MDNKYVTMERIYKLNVTVDLEELRDYYKNIVEQYQHKKFVHSEQKSYIKREAYTTDQIDEFGENVEHDLNRMPHGWSIQSYLPDENRICAPWNVLTKNPVPEWNTELYFGIAEKIAKKFPMGYRMGISLSYPGSYIPTHVDESWHVHIPIYSPKKAYFDFDDVGERHNLEAGFIYLVDTTQMHSVHNEDLEDRPHLLFSVKAEDVESVLAITGAI